MPMKRPTVTLVACLAAIAAVLVSGQALAGGRDDNRNQDRGRDHDDDRGRHDDDDDRGGAGRRISLDEAIAQAEKRYKARAVHGEEKREGDRIVYRIRLLDKDGRVFEVSVDAGSDRDK